MKKFSLGQILSISQDKLMCDIGGVYEILNYMTNDNLFTHQLPRACKECKPWIRRQLPFLNDIDLSHVNTDNWKSVLFELVDKYGKEFDVEPMKKEMDSRAIRVLDERIAELTLWRDTAILEIKTSLFSSRVYDLAESVKIWNNCIMELNGVREKIVKRTITRKQCHVVISQQNSEKDDEKNDEKENRKKNQEDR